MAFIGRLAREPNETVAKEIELYKKNKILEVDNWVFDYRKSHYQEIQELQIDAQKEKARIALEQRDLRDNEDKAYRRLREEHLNKMQLLAIDAEKVRGAITTLDGTLEERKLQLSLYDSQYQELLRLKDQQLDAYGAEIHRLNDIINKLIKLNEQRPQVEVISTCAEVRQSNANNHA